jgi:hypothetical protein
MFSLVLIGFYRWPLVSIFRPSTSLSKSSYMIDGKRKSYNWHEYAGKVRTIWLPIG